jgi:excisionase family DNA binding protein
MTALLEQHTVLPPEDASDPEFDQFVAVVSGQPQDRGRAKLIGPDGTQVVLPDEVYGVLRDVAAALAQGLAISVVPQHAELTTQQAADFLNISRPTLVRLLKDGEIAHVLRGRHRRVRLADVLDYQKRSRIERRAMLDELTRTAVEDGTADGGGGFVETR